MSKKQFFMFLFLLIILVAFSGCATGPQSYQPKSPEEVRIKDLLLKWEKTYNNHDVAGNLATWNDKAQIMYGGKRKIASKKEYADILPERMRANPILNLGTPDIKISGDKAQVSTVLSVRGSQTPTVFNLIKENDTWSIISWKY